MSNSGSPRHPRRRSFETSPIVLSIGEVTSAILVDFVADVGYDEEDAAPEASHHPSQTISAYRDGGWVIARVALKYYV